MESIAQYTQIMTELKGADWAKENIRLTGYPSEIYAYWGESRPLHHPYQRLVL